MNGRGALNAVLRWAIAIAACFVIEYTAEIIGSPRIGGRWFDAFVFGFSVTVMVGVEARLREAQGAKLTDGEPWWLGAIIIGVTGMLGHFFFLI